MKQLLCIVAFVITFISSGQDIPSDFDYGKIEDNQYSNSFFELTIDIPDGWFVQNDDVVKQLSEKGARAIGGEKMVRTIKAAEVTTANLIMVDQFDIATHTDPTIINSNFTLIAENLGVASVYIKDGKDYLDASRKEFDKSHVPIVINSETKSIDIDGETFYYFDAVLTMQGVEIKQRYISTVMNGFALLYVATYGTEDQLGKLMSILNNADFK